MSLTAVWVGSRMSPNPHGKSHHVLSKCHDLNLCKLNVMFLHGEQIKPVSIKWNSHGFGCQFRPNRHQVELWREMAWNFHVNPCHMLYRKYFICDDTGHNVAHIIEVSFSRLFLGKGITNTVCKHARVEVQSLWTCSSFSLELEKTGKRQKVLTNLIHVFKLKLL